MSKLSKPQFLKAAFGMDVTPVGIVMLFNDVHPPKHQADRDCKEFGKFISVKDEQYANAPQPIEVTVSGKTTFLR